jgi:hypothetical protein
MNGINLYVIDDFYISSDDTAMDRYMIEKAKGG